MAVKSRQDHRPAMTRRRDLSATRTASAPQASHSQAAADGVDALPLPIPRRQRFDLAALQSGTTQILSEHWPAALRWVRWNGFDLQQQCYGDLSLANRLLSGLIAAAARYNSDNRRDPAMLVRGTVHADQWLVRLSVAVEDGCFFGNASQTATPALLSNQTERTELQVWHHLASGLMTNPRITQRPGGGWAVDFDLPLDSPMAVAKQWARWRLQSATSGSANAADDRGEVHPYAWLETLLSNQIGVRPNQTNHAALLAVVAGAAVSPSALATFQRRLEHEQSVYDLAYQISHRRWVLVWDNTVAEARTRIESLAASWLQVTHPVRLRWSRITKLPLCQRQTATLLSDRFSRERLGDREPSRLGWDQPQEWVEEMLKPSAVPTDRLLAEVRHLAERLRAQNNHLNRQIRELRLADHRSRSSGVSPTTKSN